MCIFYENCLTLMGYFTCWQANRTGPVAKPSFRSAAVGFPSWSAPDVKSKTSSTSYKNNKTRMKIKLLLNQSCTKLKRFKHRKWPERRCRHFFHTGRLFHELLGPSSPAWTPSNKDVQQSTKKEKNTARLSSVAEQFMWKQNVHTALQLCAMRLAVFLKVFSR